MPFAKRPFSNPKIDSYFDKLTNEAHGDFLEEKYRSTDSFQGNEAKERKHLEEMLASLSTSEFDSKFGTNLGSKSKSKSRSKSGSGYKFGSKSGPNIIQSIVNEILKVFRGNQR